MLQESEKGPTEQGLFEVSYMAAIDVGCGGSHLKSGGERAETAYRHDLELQRLATGLQGRVSLPTFSRMRVSGQS